MINRVTSARYDENGRVLRTIRSFVRRQGRLTKGQQQAIDDCWPTMGLEYQSNPVIFEQIFAQQANVTLEIGFGMGKSLVAMATNNPQNNFLGIEVHLPGVGACLASAQQKNLSNLRVICHDAIEVLETMIPDASLQAVQLFFPDPWHKIRHNKRRIVQPAFVTMVHSKLQSGGMFHLATDWQPYAEHMLATLSEEHGFTNLSVNNDYVPRPDSRPVTKFEERGQRLGHGVWDLLFQKK